MEHSERHPRSHDPNNHARLRIDPDVVGRRMGDDMVLIHMRTNLVYALSKTAARAWELLSEGCDRSDLQMRLLEEFDVAETELADEIERLLARLSAHDLVGSGDDN